MKTRQELILDFMLALSSNNGFAILDPKENAVDIYKQAVELTNIYLENL